MRYGLIVLCLFVVIGCTENKHSLLSDDDQAVSLLLDLSIAKIAKNKYPTGLRDSVLRSYRSQICDMYDVKEEELDTILWMMQNDFERYDNLYKQLVDTLKILENEYGSGNDKPLVPYDKMIDSIKAKKKL